MKRFAVLIFIVAIGWLAAGGAAAQDLNTIAKGLGAPSFSDREKAVTALGRLGDPGAVPLLEALEKGDLYVKPDGSVVVSSTDAGGLERIRVNNALRRAVQAALGELTLFSPKPELRRKAAEAVFKSGDPAALETLGRAIQRETDDGIRSILLQAQAVATMKSDAPLPEKLKAVDAIASRGDRDALSLLRGIESSAAAPIKEAAAAAAQSVASRLAFWDAIQNVWYGISLGSVLLLAAIGLAITFGVMGVINMAHGEMVMLGAYTTFVTQQAFREYLPGATDYSILAAIPLAFVIAGAFGVAVERGVIRFLYGRPLETLLATWGLSLVLQQLVRSAFGPTNREVTTPSWMSGAWDVTGGLALTNNRIAIVIFAALVFVALTLVIKKTMFGMQMRAVTQNRAMANSVGIRSGWIDAMTFGLGSGIAGMAGVALSQIDNVSPNLGQSYIIDSFLVVVFGGVGNLWGTLVGALSLGVLNKFLEPYAGAVLGKILILVCVILFIQKRPRGLFALKGRAVES
jgi:urea transport system permease protein